jgi:predicted ATPase
LLRDGRALPWEDALAFVRRIIALSLADFATPNALGDWVFFDGSLIDALAALQS